MSIQRQKNGRVSIRHGNHIRQEYWSGLPIPTPGSNPCLLCLLHGGSLGRWILYHWATWEAPTVAQKHPYYTADPWKIQTWIHRSIYTCFFFFFPVGNTTWSRFHNPGLVESACAKEPWIKRSQLWVTCRFSTVQKTSVPNPILFKGQLYLGTEILVLVNIKKNKHTRKEIILI